MYTGLLRKYDYVVLEYSSNRDLYVSNNILIISLFSPHMYAVDQILYPDAPYHCNWNTSLD